MRGQTDVEIRNSVRISQHVDESLVSWHGRSLKANEMPDDEPS
jgi:hypothetical protein